MLITSTALSRSFAALVAAVALGACTTPNSSTADVAQQPTPQAGATQGPASPGCPGMMSSCPGSTTLGSGMMCGTQTSNTMMGGQMDKNKMCAMYRSMQEAAPQQRQSMMEHQMKGMSPEVRQQHMEMMRQQCK